MMVINAVSSNISSSVKLPPGVEFGDLVAWGIEGIVKARKKYDPKRGAQFKTYANFRVRGEILDNIRKEWSYRSPVGYKKYKEAKKKVGQIKE